MALNKIIITILLCSLCVITIGANKISFALIQDTNVVAQKSKIVKFNLLPKISLFNKAKVEKKNKSKLIASLLALTLGPFGVHRLYLGTAPKVPIAYTLTLGGGFFILPLIDVFYIILSRDPNDIEDNNHVFIWNKKKTQ